MTAIMAAIVISFEKHRRKRALDRLAAGGIVVPEKIEARFQTERLEAMVDAATRYQRQHDAYLAPAPGSNG